MGLLACVRARAQIEFLGLGGRRDVEVENVHWETDGGACVGDLLFDERRGERVSRYHIKARAKGGYCVFTQYRVGLVTYIDNSRDMPFDGDAAQHQIDLVVAVPEASEILDDTQAALAVRDGGVHVVLFPVLVDAEPFEVDHPARTELRLHGTRDVDGRFAAHHS